MQPAAVRNGAACTAADVPTVSSSKLQNVEAQHLRLFAPYVQPVMDETPTAVGLSIHYSKCAVITTDGFMALLTIFASQWFLYQVVQ